MGIENFFQSSKRFLLKISGEALADSSSFGLGMDKIAKIALDVAEWYAADKQICMVVGGGNILRGAALELAGFARTTADYMGMVATIINALAMQNALEQLNIPCRVLSSIPITAVCEPYIKRRAVRHLEKNRIVIFAAGTGNPFFSTDTAAVLRAIEMDCALLLKCTQVDGVYSADPKREPSALRYNTITYSDILAKQLRVMDASAIALARDNNMPIMVCGLDHLRNIIDNSGTYTLIQH